MYLEILPQPLCLLRMSSARDCIKVLISVAYSGVYFNHLASIESLAS